MIVFGLSFTRKIISVILFYGVGYLAIRRGLRLRGAGPGETGFRQATIEHQIAKFLPRFVVRGGWVLIGLFSAAIPTLTIIGVVAWPQSANSNSQRDAAYVDAVDQIMTPFTKSSWTTTDITVAISRLGKLVPPAQFASAQTRLVAGLRAQAALDPQIARAEARNDTAALNNLESQVQSTENTVMSATQEIDDTYNRCRSNSFHTC
jgi:hypothetical protein